MKDTDDDFIITMIVLTLNTIDVSTRFQQSLEIILSVIMIVCFDDDDLKRQIEINRNLRLVFQPLTPLRHANLRNYQYVTC